MPLFYQQNINDTTRLGVWLIKEPEDFFLSVVPLQREITHPHKRLQHLAGRYLLAFLFPDFPYEEIAIADTRKPFLPHEQYHFSLSHCGNYAAAMVSKNKRVGIDIELPNSRVLAISHKFLHKTELEEFNNDNKLPTTNYELLTVLWCAKEAIFKWWSFGSVDFRDNIRLQHFALETEGSINASFNKEGKSFELQLHYKLFEKFCLVWLMS